jgi:hypothetical protein
MMQRKAIMCARANMTYEEIKRRVSPPKGPNDENYERPAQTSEKKNQIVSELWDTKPDWEKIRLEVDINLEPRSMRFKNPDQQAAEVKEIMDYQMAMVRIAGDTLKGGNVTGAQETLRLMNASTTMICKLKNILNYEELLANPEAIGPPAPEPMSQADAVAAGQQQQQMDNDQINAAQEGAVTRLRNMGAPEGGIPEAMGGGQ